jgi:AcrR family transcriptional regulator
MQLEGTRREQIVHAAMRVFARDGYHKATIKAIAREAGIRSPGLIYHYFDDKRDLFSAVVSQFEPFHETPLGSPSREGDWLELPPERFIPRLLALTLAVRENPDAARMMRLYLSEAARSQEVAEAIGAFQTNGLAFLQRYLERQVKLGRLREHDTNSVARMLVGSALAYVLGAELFPAVAAGLPPIQSYVDAVSGVVLAGLAPFRYEAEDGGVR